MTLAAMTRATLIGRRAVKTEAIAALQAAGLLHPIDLGDAATFEPTVTPPADARRALRHLEDVPRRRTQRRDPRGFDFAAVLAAALENARKIRDAEDRRADLRRHEQALRPWGRFSFPDPDALGGRRLWFYQLERSQRGHLDAVALPWAIVARDARHLYVVVIATDEPPADLLPEPRMHTGSRTLDELEAALVEVETELEDLHAERESLSRWILLLRRRLARLEDRAAFERAHHMTRDDAHLFVLQGWVPDDRRDDLRALAASHGLALTEEPPAPDDRPPTLFENPPALAGGEDLVRFYETPRYGLPDPTPVVLFSFTVFFAMILADAAYGLVLGLAVLAAWRPMGRSPRWRRLRGLAAGLAGATVVWGVLAGNFAGVTPPDDHPLAALALVDVADFEAMMRLSVAIGCLHVAFGHLLAARAATTRAGQLRPFGWIAVIAGGYGLWQAGATLPADWSAAAIALLAGGLAWVAVWADEAPRPGWTGVLRRVGLGTLALSNVAALFSDVLSYLRLMALGLASATLAVTFNELAADVRAGTPAGVGSVLSAGVLLVGHGINLALALLSACVHGLRLNFIEFFKYAVPEDGFPFDPLRLEELEL